MRAEPTRSRGAESSRHREKWCRRSKMAGLETLPCGRLSRRKAAKKKTSEKFIRELISRAVGSATRLDELPSAPANPHSAGAGQKNYPRVDPPVPGAEPFARARLGECYASTVARNRIRVPDTIRGRPPQTRRISAAWAAEPRPPLRPVLRTPAPRCSRHRITIRTRTMEQRQSHCLPPRQLL